MKYNYQSTTPTMTPSSELVYQVNMRGAKPTYYHYNQHDRALKLYAYLWRYFSGVSIRQIPHKRCVKNMMTGRHI